MDLSQGSGPAIGICSQSQVTPPSWESAVPLEQTEGPGAASTTHRKSWGSHLYFQGAWRPSKRAIEQWEQPQHPKSSLLGTSPEPRRSWCVEGWSLPGLSWRARWPAFPARSLLPSSTLPVSSTVKGFEALVCYMYWRAVWEAPTWVLTIDLDLIQLISASIFFNFVWI